MKLDHGRWPFPWSNFHSPISLFKRKEKTKQYTKPLGPSLGVNQNVDQEEWPCTKKWITCFFKIYVKKGQFWNLKSMAIILSALVFVNPQPKKLSLKNTLQQYFSAMNPCIRSPLLPLPLQNHWTMSMDNEAFNYVFWRPRTPRSLYYQLSFGVNKGGSWDEFNNQLHIFTWPWDDYIIHGVNNPY
jgi:hypothetical protein